MWSDQYEQALVTALNGLSISSNNEDFLFKKASILNDMGQYEEAMLTVNQLLVIYPTNEKAIELRNSIKSSKQLYTVSVSAGVDLFSNRNYDPAYYSSAQLGRSNDWGSSLLRINYANRFGTSGIQGEIDLYPRIVSGVYGYLNYGYSSSSLFPAHRVGAEIFSRLPHSFETSAGIRFLRFTPNNIMIYTGSLGWYYKNLWISFRPFITPDPLAGTSVSTGLTVRRYFGNPEDYLELSGGIGYSPEIRLLQSAEGLSTNEIYTLKSQTVGLGFQKRIRSNMTIVVSTNLAHQELSPAVGYVWISSGVVRLSMNF